MTRCEVGLHHGLDIERWRAEAVADEKPDDFPYGLHHLGEFGFDVVPSRHPTSLAAKFIAGVGRRLGGGFDWLGSCKSDITGEYVRLCWEERDGIPAARHLGRSGVPVFTGVIWATEKDARYIRWVEREIGIGLRSCAGVWALSHPQLQELRDRFGVPDSRLRYVQFGIDEQFWRPDDTHVRSGVLGVGNDRHRDHSTLVEALTLLPDHRLTLVTRNPIATPPSNVVLREQLSHSQLRTEYQQAAVVAIALKPNLHVSGMTAILEAQATATPVVCTRTPGISDYVVEGESAILVPPGDPGAMAAAIKQITDDDTLAREMGAAGRRFVAESRTSRRMSNQLATMMEDLT